MSFGLIDQVEANYNAIGDFHNLKRQIQVALQTGSIDNNNCDIRLPKEKGKRLWFYNSGMSRLVWGFYLWAQGATGYSQWHWCAPFGNATGGYPGNEGYNPFTAMAAMAPHAPVSEFPGGFLYQTAFLDAAEGIQAFLERRKPVWRGA